LRWLLGIMARAGLGASYSPGCFNKSCGVASRNCWRANYRAPRKIKKGREASHSRPLPFQQRTNTSCYRLFGQNTKPAVFTAALSVFGGTPSSRKPLNCKKLVKLIWRAFSATEWAEPTGGKALAFQRHFLVLLALDIIKTSLLSYSLSAHLSLAVIQTRFPGNKKNPAFLSASRVEKSYSSLSIRYLALPPGRSGLWVSGFCPAYNPSQPKAKRTTPTGPAYDVSLAATGPSTDQIEVNMFIQVSHRTL